MRFNGQPRPRGAGGGGVRVWDSCSLWAPPFQHFPPHCPSVPPASSSFPRLVNWREGSHRQLRFWENDRMRSVKSGLILRPFLCWGLVRGQADDEGADAVPRASQSRRGDSQMLLERSGVVCAGRRALVPAVLLLGRRGVDVRLPPCFPAKPSSPKATVPSRVGGRRPGSGICQSRLVHVATSWAQGI